MQATITYMLSEQAQREAMAATGQQVARKQVITTDIPADALDLMDIGRDGEVTLDMSGGAYSTTLREVGWKTSGYGPAVAESVKTAEQIVADLRAGAAVLAEQKRKANEIEAANGLHNREVTEAVYRAFLTDPTARAGTYDGPNSLVKNTRTPADWFPNQHAEFAAEIKRRNDADAAEKERFAAEKEAAKQEFIDRWIAQFAPPEIQEQHAAKLLGRAEALAMVAENRFALAGVPAEHEVRLCKDSDCPCGVKDVDTIPTAVFAHWKPIKARLPEGTVVEFEKSRDCLRDEDGSSDGEDAGSAYYTATIKLPAGPFVFERRIKL